MGDKVASIASALIASAALFVSIVALQRGARSAARRSRNPAAMPQPESRPYEVVDIDRIDDGWPNGGTQQRDRARRQAAAVKLMTGAILLYALFSSAFPISMTLQAPLGIVLLLTFLLISVSTALAIAGTTQMVRVTRAWSGKRLIPGIVTALFFILTALPTVPLLSFLVMGILVFVDSI